MFQKILVALNKSEISLQAVDEAIALAQSMNAQLKLIHVLDDRDPDQPAFPYNPEFQAYNSTLRATTLDAYEKEYKAFIDRSWEWLKWHGERAIAAGVATEYEQLNGSPGPHICKAAQTWEADLIIVGSRCLTGLRELILGSVSNYVTHHAPCSVCVIHPKLDQNEQQEGTDTISDSASATQDTLVV